MLYNNERNGDCLHYKNRYICIFNKILLLCMYNYCSNHTSVFECICRCITMEYIVMQGLKLDEIEILKTWKQTMNISMVFLLRSHISVFGYTFICILWLSMCHENIRIQYNFTAITHCIINYKIQHIL